MWGSAISGVYDMKGIRRILLTLLFIAVIASSLAAAPRLYIGLNLTYDVNRLTKANQNEIEAVLADASGEYPAYHSGKESQPFTGSGRRLSLSFSRLRNCRSV